METPTTLPDKTARAASPLTVQARIVIAACIGLGLAVAAIIGGWAATGTLEDWETVVGGLVFILLLAGLAALARRGRAALVALLLAGLLFLIISADTAYYGLGSPTAATLLMPVLLIACTLGLRPGLAAAALGAVVVFAIAWGSVNGLLQTEIPVEFSHLSFNAPALSVVLLFCAGLTGYTVDLYQWQTNQRG